MEFFFGSVGSFIYKLPYKIQTIFSVIWKTILGIVGSFDKLPHCEDWQNRVRSWIRQVPQPKHQHHLHHHPQHHLHQHQHHLYHHDGHRHHLSMFNDRLAIIKRSNKSKYDNDYAWEEARWGKLSTIYATHGQCLTIKKNTFSSRYPGDSNYLTHYKRWDCLILGLL